MVPFPQPQLFVPGSQDAAPGIRIAHPSPYRPLVGSSGKEKPLPASRQLQGPSSLSATGQNKETPRRPTIRRPFRSRCRTLQLDRANFPQTTAWKTGSGSFSPIFKTGLDGFKNFHSIESGDARMPGYAVALLQPPTVSFFFAHYGAVFSSATCVGVVRSPASWRRRPRWSGRKPLPSTKSK